MPVNAGKITHDHNLPVGLLQNVIDVTVGPGTFGKCAIKQAGGGQTGDAPPRYRVDRGEFASNKNLPVSLREHRGNFSVGRRIKIGIERAVRVETSYASTLLSRDNVKDTYQKNSTVRLQGQPQNIPVGSGAEIAVQRTIQIEPRNSRLIRVVHLEEITCDDDFSIRLNKDRGNSARRAAESRGINLVKGSIRIQPANSSPRLAVHGCEAASDDDFSVRLQSEGQHFAVGSRQPGSEVAIRTTVAQKTHDIAARGATRRGELAADNNLAVRLHAQSTHLKRRAIEFSFERFVDTSVGMESGHAFRDKTAHSGNGKCTADDQFSVGLNGNGADCDVQLRRGKRTVGGALKTETLANERKKKNNE